MWNIVFFIVIECVALSTVKKDTAENEHCYCFINFDN